MKCNYKLPKNSYGRYGMVEKHCKKCVYKNCPEKKSKSNSYCSRFRPKKGK